MGRKIDAEGSVLILKYYHAVEIDLSRAEERKDAPSTNEQLVMVCVSSTCCMRYNTVVVIALSYREPCQA